MRDVEQFVRSGLVTKAELAAYFDAIEPHLYRFPAIDATGLRSRVHALVQGDVL